MKRCFHLLASVILVLLCTLTGMPRIQAADREEESRAIAIVFDNSGSMYEEENMAWCRATYAMEVFASMLNAGDVLQIYPMWPITVDGQTYTMEEPFQISSASQASRIRNIYTESPLGTPIESVDCAAKGLQSIDANSKYLIVLTDGGYFSLNGVALSTGSTITELDRRIGKYAGEAVTVMYLGIGDEACIPSTEESDFFVKKQAKNSADVLSRLTEMCNRIFGRDTLPKSHISGNVMDFDISMKKLIVFIQGKNISGVKIAGDSVGRQISSQQTKYSSTGAGRYECIPDTSLQGMMVTYADCPAGEYTIEYSGTATSVEVYYEPNADLDFVFTDSEGNTVDYKALYEGKYKVSFGMKDAGTNELSESDLLGQPKYLGKYYINGVDQAIECEGYSGVKEVVLTTGDTFSAELTVTYLSGYTISKTATDFGWSDEGICIVPRPAGELKLEITGGDETLYQCDLENSSPYVAKAYYNGKQLNADEYSLSLSDNSGNAEFGFEPNGDHYLITVHHKDPSAYEKTDTGSFEAIVTASHVAKGCEEAQTKASLFYFIDPFKPAGALEIGISGGQEEYSLQYLDEGEAYVVKVYYEGSLLTGPELESVSLKWDESVSNAGLEKELADDHFKLWLQYKDPDSPKDTACGECSVPVSASYTAEGCYESQAQGTVNYRISDSDQLLEVELLAPEKYIVIRELQDSRELVANVKLNGKALSKVEFASLNVRADCGGISYSLIPSEPDSSCLVKLLETEGIGEGKYSVKVTAEYTDRIGRIIRAEDSEEITLGKLPQWVRWAFRLLFLLILALIIWAILHIRVLPGYVHTTRKLSSMIFDGDDVTSSTNFLSEIRKKSTKVQGQYGGRKFGISMDVTPGKESYLYKSQKRRSATVKVASVRKFGPAKIQEAMIGSTKYVADEATGKLVPAQQNQKPFSITNGALVKFSGVIQDAGVDKDFELTSKLNFKKK